MAKPVGGQIGVALGLIEASRSPSVASVKYATPTRISVPTSVVGSKFGSNLRPGASSIRGPMLTVRAFTLWQSLARAEDQLEPGRSCRQLGAMLGHSVCQGIWCASGITGRLR